jgi:hypothetical protein
MRFRVAAPRFSSIAVFLCLALASLPLSALDLEGEIPAMLPRTARTMALGGTFVSVTKGFESLFANPAGYAEPLGEFTILKANPWIYVKPSVGSLAEAGRFSSALFSADAASAAGAADALMAGNGLGEGASLALGWVGQNLGIGAYLTQDCYMAGASFREARGNMDMNAGLVVGLALPLKLLGLDLRLGGDIRPTYTLHGTVSPEVIDAYLSSGGDFQALLEAIPAYSGLSLAVDLGLSLRKGPFSAGLAVRNIAQGFGYVECGVGRFAEVLLSGNLPSPSGFAAVPGLWSLPNIFIGASYNFAPPGISWLQEAVLYAEVQDPIRVALTGGSPLNVFHLGSEIRLLSVLALRVGVNRGYFSAGFGLDLTAFKLDAAVFTEELGKNPGDDPRTGISLEASVKVGKNAKAKQ